MKHILLLPLLLAIPSAHAYIDPGTGSYLVQLLLAGGIGALFALKTYWKAIKEFFYKKSTK